MGVGGEPGQTIQVGARSDLKHEGKYLGQISLKTRTNGCSQHLFSQN